MQNKVFKIGAACFYSGAAFGLAAFTLSSRFWPVWILIGFVPGYLGYEFRKTLMAVPIAFRYAMHATEGLPEKIERTIDKLSEVLHIARNKINEPHPFWSLALTITLPAFAYLSWNYNPQTMLIPRDHPFYPYCLLNLFSIGWEMLLLIVVTMITVVPITLFASIGSQFCDHCYWLEADETDETTYLHWGG